MSAQKTLTGDTTDDGRTVPKTMLCCDECGETVLRSEREAHPHDLSGSDAGVCVATKQALEKVPDDAILDTQTYRVELIYEARAVVTVEASHKTEAKRAAKRADPDPAVTDHLHTSYSKHGEEGQASIDYLEEHGLLPDDHDVTPTDIQRVIDHGD